VARMSTARQGDIFLTSTLCNGSVGHRIGDINFLSETTAQLGLESVLEEGPLSPGGDETGEAALAQRQWIPRCRNLRQHTM